jgi:hypothetical protein
MRKQILEKLLHTHNLFKTTDVSGYDKFTQLYRPLPHFNPRYAEMFDKPKNWEGLDREERTINYNNLGALFERISIGISNAQKFYIPNTPSYITNEERVKVAKDVQMMLPYPNTFIQWDKDVYLEELEVGADGRYTPQDIDNQIQEHESNYDKRRLVYNLWAIDTQTVPSFDNDESGMQEFEIKALQDSLDMQDEDPYTNVIRCMLFVYDTKNEHFHSDFTFFDLAWINGTENYTYWIRDDNIFYEYLDLRADTTGEFQSQTLNQQVQICSDVLFEYNFLTQFPTICDVDTVKGLKPSSRPSFIDVRKFKHTAMNAKPTWEHKVLKLNMYDNAGVGSKGGNTRSAGTAFHSVRKHLRRLPNGKHTFVKAHFRGSKEVGVVSKEYKIDR